MTRSRQHYDEDPVAEGEDWQERKLIVYDENGDKTVILATEWDDQRQVPLYTFTSEAQLSLSDIEALVHLAREKFGTLRGLSAQTHYTAISDAADTLRKETERWLTREAEEG